MCDEKIGWRITKEYLLVNEKVSYTELLPTAARIAAAISNAWGYDSKEIATHAIEIALEVIRAAKRVTET